MRRSESIETNSNFSKESSSETLICSADVIVVGAGISGLTAAYRLLRKDPALRITVLEAKENIGGRTQTVQLEVVGCAKKPFDVGGQWIGSSQKHISQLLKELELETFQQYTSGQTIGHFGSIMDRFDSGFPTVGSWYCRYELYHFIKKIECLASKISWHAPMENAYAEELDTITLDTLLRNSLKSKTATDVIQSLVQTSLGTDASKISALFFVAFANGTHGFLTQHKASIPGAREQRIKGGAHQIPQKLLNQIGESSVKLADPVVCIEQSEDVVHIITGSRRLYKCDYVIMAVPPNEVKKITFIPPLPFQHKKLLEYLPVGHLIKFVTTYKQAFWRENGLSGDAISDGGTNSEEFPVSMTFDASTAEGHPAIGGYLTGSQSFAWSEKDEQERRKLVLNHIAKLFGSCALEPIDYVEKNWSEEPFIGGCPFHHTTPGVMSWMYYIRQPFNRIYWAGTETATSWCGYINGAVQAGNRAAIEVLYELRPQVLTALDLEDVYEHSERWEEPHMTVPHVYRWTVWFPLGLIGFGYLMYCLRSHYWFIGTGRIA